MLGIQVLLSLCLSLGLFWNAFAFDRHKKDNVSCCASEGVALAEQMFLAGRVRTIFIRVGRLFTGEAVIGVKMAPVLSNGYRSIAKTTP